jgi:hypothetical protein
LYRQIGNPLAGNSKAFKDLEEDVACITSKLSAFKYPVVKFLQQFVVQPSVVV